MDRTECLLLYMGSVRNLPVFTLCPIMRTRTTNTVHIPVKQFKHISFVLSAISTPKVVENTLHAIPLKLRAPFLLSLTTQFAVSFNASKQRIMYTTQQRLRSFVLYCHASSLHQGFSFQELFCRFFQRSLPILPKGSCTLGFTTKRPPLSKISLHFFFKGRQTLPRSRTDSRIVY